MDVHDIEAWRKLLKERGAALEKLRQIQETIGLSKEDRMKYDESIKVYRDQLAMMEYERRKGEAKERLKNARGMKAAGIAPDLIAQIMELPLETVEGL